MKTKQPIIRTVNNLVHMDCPVCQVHKVVECTNARFAYTEINNFRITHEHYEGKEES